MIHRWMDRGLDKQLELILAIREGRFEQTPTGRYLLAVKDSFSPEVFFDLVCYVQLHIELLIAAKSRFMACEAEMDYKMDDEHRRTLLSQYEEYRELERRPQSSRGLDFIPLRSGDAAGGRSLF